MAGKTITMSKLKQIIRLRGNGVSLQRISKGVGISRNTVKKYLKLIEVKGLDHDELLGMADEQLTLLLSDPDQISTQRHKALKKLLPYFEKELQRTGVTRWVLWGEINSSILMGSAMPISVITCASGLTVVEPLCTLNITLEIRHISTLPVKSSIGWIPIPANFMISCFE